MTFFRNAVGGLLPLVLLALAAPAAAVAAEAEPAWLTAARAHEGKLIDAKAFRSKDGALTGRVPAKLRNKVELEDQTYYLELDIGTETPVSCDVLVVGMVIVRPADRYATYGHAWAELREGDRWVVADAALGSAAAQARYVPLGLLEDEGPGFLLQVLDTLTAPRPAPP
jgi:hypothetical protein